MNKCIQNFINIIYSSKALKTLDPKKFYKIYSVKNVLKYFVLKNIIYLWIRNLI